MQWKYKIITRPGMVDSLENKNKLEEELNKHGKEGWEAVAVTGMAGGGIVTVLLKRLVK